MVLLLLSLCIGPSVLVLLVVLPNIQEKIDTAKKNLAEAEPPPLNQKPRCKKCGSTRLKETRRALGGPPVKTARFCAWYLWEARIHCKDCGAYQGSYTYEVQESDPP